MIFAARYRGSFARGLCGALIRAFFRIFFSAARIFAALVKSRRIKAAKIHLFIFALHAEHPLIRRVRVL